MISISQKKRQLSFTFFIKVVVIAFALITAVFMLFNDLPLTNGYRLYFFVPLIFACVLIFSRAVFRNFTNIVVLLFMLVSIVRFIVMPFFGSLCEYDYLIGQFIEAEYSERAILLAIFETAVCTVFLNFAVSRILKEGQSGVFKLNISFDGFKPVFIFIIITAAALLLVVPGALSRYSVIFLQTEYENSSDVAGIIFTFIELGRASLMLIALGKLKKIYEVKPSVWCLILSLLLVLINACIVDGLSRWTILLPLAIYGLMILNWYPRYRKGLILFFIAALAVLYIFSTAVRYGFDNFSALSIYDKLQMYFSGVRNMAFGIKTKEFVNFTADIYPFKTVFADWFYSVVGFSHFVERADATLVIFNDFLRGDGVSYDMIIPFISQSTIMLGYVGAPILECAVIFAALKISVKIYKGIDSFEYFYLMLALIWLARLMTVNITIIFSQLFNSLVVFYFFYLLNSLLPKKGAALVQYGKKIKNI